MYPHKNSDSECRGRWSFCFCFWFLLLYQRWCWQFVWEVTHVMQRAPSLRGHLRNWSFCYLNAGFLTLLVWSLRPFSISTYSDWLNTDRLGSSIGSVVVVVVLFGFFWWPFPSLPGFKKGWFWLLWTWRSHDSSAATDQPIGAMQSDDVAI